MQINPNRVFVIGIDGKPLMPTKRFGMARWLPRIGNPDMSKKDYRYKTGLKRM